MLKIENYKPEELNLKYVNKKHGEKNYGFLTGDYLWELFKNNPELRKYIPDSKFMNGSTFSRFKRGFLCSVNLYN